jgi:protein SCO1/2
MAHRWSAILVAAVLLSSASRAGAGTTLPPILRDVGFDQRLDEQLPLDLAFKDEDGRPVVLRDYFNDRPVVLVLAYFRCPMLCTEVLNGLVRALLDMPLEVGRDFTILTVSFDPHDTAAMARAKKKTYLERYGKPGGEAGWHFLTGEQAAIDRITKAVGFCYVYDRVNDQYAHAGGLIVLTPSGRISRYFYDIKYQPGDLRLGLVEASGNRIGSPVDQVLLYCFHYDPALGKYGPTVMAFIRAGGVLTMLAIGLLVVYLRRQEIRNRNRQGALGAGVSDVR